MKRIPVFCLTLLMVAGLYSCNKGEDDHGDGGKTPPQVTFRRANLNGASSLALVQSAGVKGPRTKDNGYDDMSISAPLYKVSADGSLVQVDYTIEVTTHGEEEGELITEQLKAGLTLKIEYIYPLGENWLWLYNCDYSYPESYTEMPHGAFRNALSAIFNDGNNFRQHYLVRLTDGALFKMDRTKGGIIRATNNPNERSPKEMQCVVEEIGGNLYYLNEEKKLFCLVDRGNTLELTQVLSNTIQNEFILGAGGTALGIMPLYGGQGTQYTAGQPSVVFPLPTGIQGISGLDVSDAGVAQLVSARKELYVFRKTGNTGAELSYPAGDVSLKVGGNTVSLMKMPSPVDNTDGQYATPLGEVLTGTLYSHACYRTQASAGDKVYVCKGTQTFGSGDFSYYDMGDGIYNYFFSTATGALGAAAPVLTIESAGTYSFYLLTEERSDGGFAGYLCAIPEGNNTIYDPNGFDRYDDRASTSLYKVELSGSSAVLQAQPVVSFFDEMPRFNQGTDDFNSRTRRVFSSKAITWITEDHSQNKHFANRADIEAGTYSRSELPKHFPASIDAYYEGVAYVVSEDNKGLYKCSLATATEEKLVVDYAALAPYQSQMRTAPGNPVFVPGIVPSVKMSAYLLDGSALTIYVDLEGPAANKAKVYVSSASGAGEVLSVLVRLN